MKDKVFIDTNLLVYAISTDTEKTRKIEFLLSDSLDFVISTQVINEFIHTCFRKNLLPAVEIRNAVEDFLLFFELVTIQEDTILLALDLKERHRFSWYDALIVASAFENNYVCLYSEDMQHSQIVEKKLAIQNPFML